MVHITMKRKLCYKKPYKEEEIDTTQLSLGLQYLISNHKSYYNVKPLIMSLQDALDEEKIIIEKNIDKSQFIMLPYTEYL